MNISPFLFLFLTVSSAAQAPLARIANSSHSRQTRTVMLRVPVSLAETIPQRGLVALPRIGPDGRPVPDALALDHSNLYEVAPKDGSEARTIHLRLALGGDEACTTDLSTWVGLDQKTWKELLPPHTLDWLLDRPEDSAMFVEVSGEGGIERVRLSLPQLLNGYSTELCPVVRQEARGREWRLVLYATIPRGSDVFDLQGHFTWSTPRRWTRACKVQLKCGERLIAHVNGPLAQSVAPDGALVILDQTVWPTDHSNPFWATLIAEHDVGPDATNTSPMPGRRAASEAAIAPISIMPTASMWASGIGPYRARISENALPFGQDPDSATPIRTKRAYDSDRGTGNTGDQGCFGVVAGFQALTEPNPYRSMWGLRVVASARFVRGHHFLNPNSDPFVADWSDERLTYNAMKFGRLDKSWRAWGLAQYGDGPWGWDIDGGAGLSEQHRGQTVHGLALLLLADPILRDELDALIACDTRSIRNRERQIDAPRAAGRQLLEWAWFHQSAPAAQRTHIRAIMDRIVGALEQIPSLRAGVVRTGGSIGPQPSRGIEVSMSTPWQDSILVDGLWAVVLLRIPGLSDRAETMLHPLAESVVHYGFAEHEQLGTVVISYLQANANGAPNEAAYFRLPRTLAKTDLGPAPANMIWGGIGSTWYSGAILYEANRGDVRAIQLRSWLMGSLRNVADWQWIIGRL